MAWGWHRDGMGMAWGWHGPSTDRGWPANDHPRRRTGGSFIGRALPSCQARSDGGGAFGGRWEAAPRHATPLSLALVHGTCTRQEQPRAGRPATGPVARGTTWDDAGRGTHLLMGSISFRSSYFWHSLVSNDLHSLLRLFSLAAAASPRSHDRSHDHALRTPRRCAGRRPRARAGHTQMDGCAESNRDARAIQCVNACGADVALTGRGR